MNDALEARLVIVHQAIRLRCLSRLIFGCGLFLLGIVEPVRLAYAQESVPQNESRIAEAVRVDRPPRLDGTLHDPLWQSAKPIADFRQREPHEGAIPTEKTEVRVLY